jgi:glycosyltransferase involved in cell wall biosynthesis
MMNLIKKGSGKKRTDNCSLKKRIAVISTTTPPSPSGQAVALYSLLNRQQEYEFILIRTGENLSTQGKNPFKETSLKEEHIDSFIINAKRTTNRKRLSWLMPISFLLEILEILTKVNDLLRLAKDSQIDAVIACSGRLSDIPSAKITCKILGLPLILYIFDDYVLREVKHRRYLALLLEHILKKYPTSIIVTNELLKEDYERRGFKKVDIVRNPTPARRIVELRKSILKIQKEHFEISFFGAIYNVHYDSIKRLIDALSITKKSWVLSIYTSANINKLKEMGFNNDRVNINPHIDHESAINYMMQSDALFLPLAFNSNPEIIRTSSPGKIGDYLASGSPIIVHAPPYSFTSIFFKQHKCGLVVDKPETRDLARALDDISDINVKISNLKEISQNIALSEFDEEINQLRLQSILKELFKNGK